ncbi:hypothetical protein [Candidatus Odyssella thessalonicensis]|uniref:hypothetical protein n=1 Tax=Candidatus Odyssella thessalonicensis TaxID=84647 RepID=UPI0002DF6846|nr:hypothetical protein [Candidatus Odyssella thessalonicensis]
MLTICQKVVVACLSLGGIVSAMEYTPIAQHPKVALGEDLRPGYIGLQFVTSQVSAYSAEDQAEDSPARIRRKFGLSRLRKIKTKALTTAFGVPAAIAGASAGAIVGVACAPAVATLYYYWGEGGLFDGHYSHPAIDAAKGFILPPIQLTPLFAVKSYKGVKRFFNFTDRVVWGAPADRVDIDTHASDTGSSDSETDFSDTESSSSSNEESE